MGKINRELIEYNGISECPYTDLPNFKQVNTDYIFCIPDQKPDIEQITKVWVDGCIIDTEIIKTPEGTSLEGQNLTGYKLLVCGDINLKIQYVACESSQGVHNAHTTFPFCGYVVLPKDIGPNAIVKASIAIEDIFSEQMDLRCIYNNITMLIIADVC
jgi:hypothetical protein